MTATDPVTATVSQSPQANAVWRHALSLLNRDQRIGFGRLLVVMVITMALETLSVAILMPVIMIATYGEKAAQLPGVPEAFRPFVRLVCGGSDRVPDGAVDTPKLLAVASVLGILVALYTLRTASVVIQTALTSDYTFSLQHSIATRLFKHYLSQPYEFHLGRNTAHLLRNILNETHHFAVSYVTAFLMTIADGLVLFGVVVLLMYIAPIVTLVTVGMLGVAAAAMGSLTRAKLVASGRERLEREARQHQYAQQGLSGVKDVILLGKEDAFLSYYAAENHRLCQIYKHQHLLQQLPRVSIEWMGVATLAIAIITMNLLGSAREVIIPTVGVMAAGAFRLMPTLTRLMHSLQTLRYNRSVVEVLSRELQGVDQELQKTNSAITEESLACTETLELQDVHYCYPGSSRAVVQGISIRIPQGSTVGLIGPSGAGKSTLVDLALGLLAPTRGRVAVDGVDIRTAPASWRRNVGYVPQSIYLTDDSLRCNIALGVPNNAIDDNRLRECLDVAQLSEFVSSLPDGLDTKVGERGVRLSGGQRQRIGIARAMYHRPNVLVLDEATSNLDINTEQEFMRAIERLHGHMTIVIVAHRLSTVANCDTVYVLQDGQITASGAAGEILSGREDIIAGASRADQ